MEISIVIVNYNTPELTLSCIESIRKNPPDVLYEIIVIDNGSSGSQLFANKLYRLIRDQSNLGFAKANNQGIKEARGKYILLLNSDTKVKKGAVEKLVEFAEANVDAGAVGAKLLNVDGSPQGSAFRFPTVFRAIQQYWLGKEGLLDKYVPSKNIPQEVESLSMAAFLITPEALKKVGLLDEKYFMYFEDLDYCRRIQESGLKVYYLPESEVVHVHGASGKGVADAANQWRRLIPSSIKYHGWLRHQIINFIIRSGGKLFANAKN